MNYWHLRLTGLDSINAGVVELSKRHVPGFGVREGHDKNGIEEVEVHAHFVIFTDKDIVKNFRQALQRAGVSGNDMYSLQRMKKTFEELCQYCAKEYSPETLVYHYGLDFSVEAIQGFHDAFKLRHDPHLVNVKKRKHSIMEELCDGLDSTASRHMIGVNVVQYMRDHIEECKFWSFEKQCALVSAVELQLKGHDVKFVEDLAFRISK